MDSTDTNDILFKQNSLIFDLNALRYLNQINPSDIPESDYTQRYQF